MDRQLRDKEYESFRSTKSRSNYDEQIVNTETSNHSRNIDERSPPSQQGRSPPSQQNRVGKLKNLSWQRSDDDDEDGGVLTTRNTRSNRTEADVGSIGFQRRNDYQNGHNRESTNDTHLASRATASYTHSGGEQRQNPSERIPQASQNDYSLTPRQNTASNGSRSYGININISINFSGRTPQVSVDTDNVPSRVPPTRSTATIENVRYIDLDIRTPNRTARLETDGIIHYSPSKQSTNY